MKKRNYKKPVLEIDYCNDDTLTIFTSGDNIGGIHDGWFEEDQ